MNQWEKEFVALIVSSAILSGIAYYLQYEVFSHINFDLWNITGFVIRTVRMILIYVIPILIFLKRYGGTWKDLGILPSREMPFLSVIGGALIYFIAIYVFLDHRIFFGGWAYEPWHVSWIKLFFIGIMASITDLWTRGFILLQLSKRYRDRTAIFWQNVTWFVLHIYEIDLLAPYIEYWGAIALTLVLGIGGDLIALRTRSIFGLMVGHVLLNLMIILAAKDVLFFYPF